MVQICITDWTPPYSVIAVSKVLRREMDLTLRPAMELASSVGKKPVVFQVESNERAALVATELRKGGAVVQLAQAPGAV